MRRWALLVLLGACRPVMAPKVPTPEGDPSDAWEALLGQVVTTDGLVDYDKLEASRGPLDDYVAWIGKDRHPPRSNQRHAFMLNAYNALVMFQVLERGRPASVNAVDGWLPQPGSAFFFETAFLVDGTPTSLHEIDAEYLRFKQLDYRDHAAINGGFRGGPPLRNTLYDNTRLDRQLREQMMRWVADDARGVHMDDGVVVFSALFDWYAYDFDFQTQGDDLCTIASRFASGAKKLALRKAAAIGCPHRYAEFDDALNDGTGQAVVPPEPSADEGADPDAPTPVPAAPGDPG